MLTFEYNEKDKTLEIFIDESGRQFLLSLLQHLNKPGDHEHLMTPAWSGDELSDKAHNIENSIINMVTIGIPKS